MRYHVKTTITLFDVMFSMMVLREQSLKLIGSKNELINFTFVSLNKRLHGPMSRIFAINQI